MATAMISRMPLSSFRPGLSETLHQFAFDQAVEAVQFVLIRPREINATRCNPQVFIVCVEPEGVARSGGPEGAMT